MKKKPKSDSIPWVEGVVDLALTVAAVALDLVAAGFLGRRRPPPKKRR